MAVRANLIDQLVYAEGYTEVEQVKGVRMVLDDAGTPQFEYLIQWKVSRSLAQSSYYSWVLHVQGAPADQGVASAARCCSHREAQLPVSSPA